MARPASAGRVLWTVLGGVAAVGVLATVGFAAYWGGQHDVVRKVRARYVEPYLASRQPVDEQQAAWETIATNLHVLQTAKVKLSQSGAPAWALEKVGDNLIFATRFGQFSYLDANDRFHPLDLQVPMRLKELRESAIYKDPVFQIDQFRTLDLLVRPAGDGRFTLYASHHRYADNCFQIVVSRTELLLTPKGVSAPSKDWDTVFVSRNCIAPKDKGMRFAGHEGGGRLALLDDDTLLLSTGVYQFDGIDGDYQAGQDSETDLGKIIAISLSTGKARIYARGLRNPQGLTVAKDGRVWETEHGPRGGDEVNLIRDGGNYGWPIVTYGTEYGAPATPWRYNPTKNAHDGFDRPKYAFVPSVGISNIIEPDTREFPLWNRHLIAESLYGSSLFLLMVEADDIIYAEPISFAPERLRDIVSMSDGRIAMVTDSGKLILVRNAARHDASDTTLIVTGLSSLAPPSPEESPASAPPDALGARTFQYYCATCHTLSGEVAAAPPLNGVIGRKIGGFEGYGYSQALKSRGGVWTKHSLKAFIRDPQGKFPGTAMPAIQLDSRQATALVDYLETIRARTPPKGTD